MTRCINSSRASWCSCIQSIFCRDDIAPFFDFSIAPSVISHRRSVNGFAIVLSQNSAQSGDGILEAPITVEPLLQFETSCWPGHGLPQYSSHPFGIIFADDSPQVWNLFLEQFTLGQIEF